MNITTPTSPGVSKSSRDRSSLSKDDVFHVLQTRRRRDVIRFLLDSDDPVRMSAVTEAVAASECETTVEDLTSAQRQRVYISLYQSHLPKLDRMGVIEYDQDQGIVRSTGLVTTFEPYLDGRVPAGGAATAGNTQRDTSYYLGASGVSVTILALTAIGQLTVPGFVLGAVVVGLFLATSALASLE